MFQAIDHGVKGGIFLPARHQVQGLCVQFIADAVLVVACRGDDEKERLFPGIAGAFGQDIIELAVRLGVDFVKDQARHIEAVLGPGFCRQHLVKTGITVIDDALPCRPNFGAAHQGRTHLDHLPCHIKDDGRLVSVTGRAVHFGARFVIGVEKVECDGRCQLAVMRLHHRPPRQIAMARAVHLDALHGNLIIQRLDFFQIMKTGTRLFFAFPSADAFSMKFADRLIRKGGEPYLIQCLACRFPIAGRRA